MECGVTDGDECSPIPDCVATDAQIQLSRLKLMDFRSCLLLPVGSTSLYVGDDLACGLPLQTIDTFVENCKSTHTVSDLEELCGSWHLARKIMQVIDNVYHNIDTL